MDELRDLVLRLESRLLQCNSTQTITTFINAGILQVRRERLYSSGSVGPAPRIYIRSADNLAEITVRLSPNVSPAEHKRLHLCPLIVGQVARIARAATVISAHALSIVHIAAGSPENQRASLESQMIHLIQYVLVGHLAPKKARPVYFPAQN
jgi:hypothetical protein